MILGNSPAAKICAELVRLAEDEKITIVLSVLCYTEVRGYPNKKPYPPELDKKCLDFFDNARLLIVDVNRRVSLVARRLAHQYGYKPLDALHLATRSEEQTFELQSRENLVCRLLLEKNK